MREPQVSGFRFPVSGEPKASPAAGLRQVIVRPLGRRPYQPVWRAMREFTDQRDKETPDELWLVEHEPVYTQGLAGKPEHLLSPGDIPVVETDRGGQVTYHGPGQVVIYPLIDIQRRDLGVRCLVDRMEQAVIDLLAADQIQAARREGAPGVYIGEAKIASIGLKVRHGRTYHGLALNVAMDLAPFAGINPCGFSGLAMTQYSEWVPGKTWAEAAAALIEALCTRLEYHPIECSN